MPTGARSSAIIDPQSPFGKSGWEQFLAIGVSESVEHKADHGGSDHGLGNFRQLLIVLGQAMPSSEQAECIDRTVALAAFELLGCVIAIGPPFQWSSRFGCR